MNESIKQLFVSHARTLHDCIAILDQTGKGIALVVDDEVRLVGTVTDGDIRRAILSGFNLEAPVQLLLDQRAGTSYAIPLTAPVGTPEVELLHLMTSSTVRHIPLVDERALRDAWAKAYPTFVAPHGHKTLCYRFTK